MTNLRTWILNGESSVWIHWVHFFQQFWICCWPFKVFCWGKILHFRRCWCWQFGIFHGQKQRSKWTSPWCNIHQVTLVAHMAQWAQLSEGQKTPKLCERKKFSGNHREMTLFQALRECFQTLIVQICMYICIIYRIILHVHNRHCDMLHASSDSSCRKDLAIFKKPCPRLFSDEKKA